MTPPIPLQRERAFIESLVQERKTVLRGDLCTKLTNYVRV